MEKSIMSLLGIVEVYNKNVYGRELTFPHNELARQLAALAGKKTLSHVDISRLEAIGFTVKNLTFSPNQS